MLCRPKWPFFHMYWSHDTRHVDFRGLTGSQRTPRVWGVIIKAVLDMPPPLNIKEVQCLTGRIAALSRFISKASDKCQPFFQVLKKAFSWDTHCEEAFSALKTYLSSPPILVSPSEGELLTLYLAVSDFSTCIVLIRDKD